MNIIEKISKFSNFKILGFIFIILYLIILIYKIPKYGISSVIWYCDWVMLFSGIALILNHRKSLSVLYLQALIVQLPWFIDSFFLGIFGTSPLGVSNYLFNSTFGLIDFILSLRHYLVIPTIFIYFLYQKFYTKKSFHLVFNVITFIFIIGLSLLFTNPIENTNCSYNPCIKVFPEFDSLIIHLTTFFIMLIVIQFILLKPILKLFNISKRNVGISKKIVLIFFIVLASITIGKYII